MYSEIRKLSHEELMTLIIDYDKYVIEICDREDGSIPVCLCEFYDNDYIERNN